MGEGVLSASFIPVYSRLLAEGETELAGRVAGIVASLLALAVSVIVLLGILLTPFLVDVIAPGFHDAKRLLTVHLVQIMFPGVGLFVLSAWCLGILNSHRLFFISYVAPVLWNVAMIGTLLGFGGRQSQTSLAVTLAWGSVAGALLQFGIQLPFIYGRKSAGGKSIGSSIVFALDTTLAPIRQVFRSLGPVVVSRGVVQLSAYIDSIIASLLGMGAVAGLANAQIIYTLPISLFGMSVAAAELPECPAPPAPARKSTRNFALVSSPANGTSPFSSSPAWPVSWFLAVTLSPRFARAATLEHRKRSMSGTSSWGPPSDCWPQRGAGSIPPPFMRCAIPAHRFGSPSSGSLLTAALGLLFAFPLRPYLNSVLLHALHLPKPTLPGIDLGLGAVGLTLSAGMAGWIEFLLLRRALQARIGSTALPNHYPAKIWAAALSASAAGWAAGRYVHLGIRWVNLGVILAAFGTIYALLTLCAGIPEARSLLRRR